MKHSQHPNLRRANHIEKAKRKAIQIQPAHFSKADGIQLRVVGQCR